MGTTLVKHFAAIGARIDLRHDPAASEYTLDVVRDRRGEHFQLRGARLDALVAQHVDRRSRHILIRDAERTNPATAGENRRRRSAPTLASRFLCGYDERHWFVAAIADPVVTVREARLSLAPAAIRAAVARERHRDRRHNALFTRQGEWFFVPSALPAETGSVPIHRNEPITRGRGKSHWCEELVRFGGTRVHIYQGAQISDLRLANLLARNRRLKFRTMMREAEVYVRGRVRHDDHATIQLTGWHRVYLNNEFTSGRVAFYD